MVNGSPTAEFSMERGIRQDDTAAEALNVMMEEAYTLLLGEWLVLNATNLQLMLKCFEHASGLQINMQKSQVLGIGVPSSETDWLARRLHCCTGSLPFIYLEHPVGANMKRNIRWKVVETKTEKS